MVENTGSIQAAASMNEPFAELSEFGKENNPEYQKYLERIREEQAKKDAKKAQRSALIRSYNWNSFDNWIDDGNWFHS